MEPIAIIGIGCRYPGGANGPDRLWKMLLEGTDAITEIPGERWDISSFYNNDRSRAGKSNTRWGGFIDSLDKFDASFFGVSPREALHMDPQQRVLMEISWEALEDAGLIPSRLAGSRTGVFVGGFCMDYQVLSFKESNLPKIGSHTATGVSLTMLAARLSFLYDLRGPSIAVDTACSSSLVSVHLACQSLWNGEADMALAGGVNAMIIPDPFISESKAGMLSPTGRSKAFDASADGYVRGEGAGIVVLKPYSKAIEDGDHVYALIRGTAVNQDGHTPGITVPRKEAQIALMREAFAKAGIDPSQASYMEAHGTGTPVGDPLEAGAIGTVVSEGRKEGDKCWISSIKTNIGHTEAAAGVAGLIKTAMILKHKQIPAHLHFKNPNPDIDFEALKLQVPQKVEQLPSGTEPLFAGVNSFGYGGTNAHVVLQEAPAITTKPSSGEENDEAPQLSVLPLSARSEEALKETALRFREYIQEKVDSGDVTIEQLLYSAVWRREHHPHRLAVIFDSKEALSEKLALFADGVTGQGIVSGRINAYEGNNELPPIVFVFTGMGPQWWAMGRQLYEQEAVFRDAAVQCDELFRKHAGFSILDEMLKDEASSRMEETEIAQPANFVIQVALAALWESRGIRPAAIVGHSAGEVAAVYLAGILNLEDACRVIYHRSRLQQTTTGQGKLVAVGLSLEAARAAIEGFESRVSIAAVNSPGAVTLVGDEEALGQVVKPLEEQGVFVRYLQVKVPYHSHYMNPLRDEIIASLQGLTLHDTQTVLYSTVTGKRIQGNDFGPEYWFQNVREPVYFALAVDELIQDGYRLFLEIGPHPVLANSIQECLAKHGQTGRVLPSIRRNEHEQTIFMNSLGSLYTLGFPVNWNVVNGAEGHYKRLPTYPWQQERYWNESAASELFRIGRESHPLLGKRKDPAAGVWLKELDKSLFTYLDDHQIQGNVVYPGAGYIEMGIAAAKEMYGDSPAVQLENIQFHKALFLQNEGAAQLQLRFETENGGFKIYSGSGIDNGGHSLHAAGQVTPSYSGTNKKVKLSEIIGRCGNPIDKEELYTKFRMLGLEYGTAFQGIAELQQGHNEAIARLSLPKDVWEERTEYQIHPVLIDYCLQAMVGCLPFPADPADAKVFMPTGIESGFLVKQVPSSLWVHASASSLEKHELAGNIRLLDDEGHVLFELNGVRVKALQDNPNAWRVPGYYEIQWKQLDLVQEAELKEGNGAWIVLADHNGVGDELIQQLQHRGEYGIKVSRSADGSYNGSLGHYRLDPSNPAHFYQLLHDALNETALPIAGVVHAWSLELDRTEEMSVQDLSVAEEIGCHAVLYLVQAMANASWRKKPRFWILTKGAQSVEDNSAPIHIAQSALWGLARVIGHQEHTDIWGGIVDLDSFSAKADLGLFIEQLRRHDGEDQIAYRNGQRYAARFTDAGDLKVPVAPTFRPDGSYLITGGFGGLGLLVARWLIERGARRLILVGRSPLPERSEWHAIDPDSQVGERIREVRRLEQLGASVHVVGFDIADEEALVEFLNQYKEEGWPTIRGIIHSAGFAKPQLLLNMDADTFKAVTRPKIIGAWNLHKHFQDETLDFFVMFSSIAAQLTSTGQGNYSAGNSFMDALAYYRKSKRLPALSINWGPWAEVGMAEKLDLNSFFEQRGNYPIQPHQGLHALASLLRQDRPNAAVVSVDWEVVTHKNYSLGLPAMVKDLVLQQQKDGSANRAGEAGRNEDFLVTFFALKDPEERRAKVISATKETIAKVMGISLDKLLTDQPLNTLGLDSMLALEMKNHLEKTLSVNITVVDLLKGPSIEQLSSQIQQKMEEIEQASNDEAALMQELEGLSDEEVLSMLQEVSIGMERHQ